MQKLSSNPAITLLVNNAGVSNVEPVSQVSLDTITNLVRLNVTALTALTSAVLPHFLERNSGTIISVGSVVGFSGYPWTPVYGGTKAYVLNFTQSLKLQLKETALRLQFVAPSATVSEIWDTMGFPISNLGPGVVMTTEDCIDAALTGLDNGEFITAPSMHDERLVQEFEKASAALLAATQNDQPAPRYGIRK